MQQLTDEQRKQLEEKIKKMSPEELREFQKQNCIFCQIIAGKIPARKVYDDERSIAVLDIRPATKGHILILPREHYAILPQMPEKEIAHLFSVAKHLSQAALQVLRSDGTTLFVANGPAAGQQAQHVMLHLIPRKEGDGLLPAQEKILGKDLLQKVRSVLQEPLAQALGAPSKKAEGKAGKEQPAEESPEQSEAGKEEAREPEEAVEEIPEETAEENRKEPTATKKPAKKATQRRPKTKEQQEESTMAEKKEQKRGEEPEEGTARKKKNKKSDHEHLDLDEIASLFQ